MIDRQTNLTPNGTTIKHITYHIDKYGVLSTCIEIDPPITVHIGDKGIEKINYSVINLGSNIEPGYEKIGVGSKINIKRNPIYESESLNYDGVSDIINTHLKDVTRVELIDNANIKEDAPHLVVDLCPACGSHLATYNGQLICNNLSCPAQILERCTRFIRACKMHLHGIYYQILCICIGRGYVKTPADIFSLTDEQIKSTMDDTQDKHVSLFRQLVNDVIGKVSMTRLLVGLNIVPSEDAKVIEDFVAYQNDGHRKIGELFDIKALINLVDTTVKKFGLIVDYTDKDKQQLTVNDQILKLSDTDMEALKEMYGDIGSYCISAIIDYVLNPTNRKMLEKLDSLKLIGHDA